MWMSASENSLVSSLIVIRCDSPIGKVWFARYRKSDGSPGIGKGMARLEEWWVLGMTRQVDASSGQGAGLFHCVGVGWGSRGSRRLAVSLVCGSRELAVEQWRRVVLELASISWCKRLSARQWRPWWFGHFVKYKLSRFCTVLVLMSYYSEFNP